MACNVELELERRGVTIRVEWKAADGVQCPQCGRKCAIAGHAPQRARRHPETMQFETRVVARAPRCRCLEHGVKNMSAPQAEPNSRFTLLFECFAVEALLACRSVSQACELLRPAWDTARRIMDRAVRRGLARRDLETLRHVGIDEKIFRAGQPYVSAPTGLDQSRVLEVAEGADIEAAKALWGALPQGQRRKAEEVALDMAAAFVAASRAAVPQAALVHDS